MDTTVNPGDDFYRYVNGKWLDNNPIPKEYSSYGNMTVLLEQNYNAIREIIENAAADTTCKKGSNKQKIGDFYSSGMDTAKIEKDGILPILNSFKKIEEIKDNEDLINAIANMHAYGINTVFGFYPSQDAMNNENVIVNLYQGGLGLPDRDYYLNDDPRSLEVVKEYKKHIQKMFSLLDKNEDEAKKVAEDVLTIEKQLAEASLSRVEMRNPYKNYHKMSIEELKKSTPNILWDIYFKEINLTDKSDLNLAHPDFFNKINQLFEETDIETWKHYLRWNTLNSTASYLSKKFVEQDFSFYSTFLTGVEEMQPRWKKVQNTVNGLLGDAVGELYVEQYFPPEAKARMLELVNNLKLSLKDRITQLEWMSDSTKTEALKKLSTMKTKIGYPDKWIDYSSLDIDNVSYLQNVLNARHFEFNFNLNKVGKPVDRDEWFLTPQTINAYYHPLLNEVVFPAAILQPPFFNLEADDAINYGAIGAVIGHEMTHAFDDQGRQYDKEGNLHDWWLPIDAENFMKQVNPLISQYNKYEVMDSVFVNGELTLGENIADLGGITIAYNAYLKTLENGNEPEPIDGFTGKQRF
ncbi:MAG: peptidase M13, partial [Marinilabiliales bacterium]